MISAHPARVGISPVKVTQACGVLSQIWEGSLTRLLVHADTVPEQITGEMGIREEDLEARYKVKLPIKFMGQSSRKPVFKTRIRIGWTQMRRGMLSSRRGLGLRWPVGQFIAELF